MNAQSVRRKKLMNQEKDTNFPVVIVSISSALIHGWKEQTHVPLVGPTSDS